jgi:hypothetical protein
VELSLLQLPPKPEQSKTLACSMLRNFLVKYYFAEVLLHASQYQLTNSSRLSHCDPHFIH